MSCGNRESPPRLRPGSLVDPFSAKQGPWSAFGRQWVRATRPKPRAGFSGPWASPEELTGRVNTKMNLVPSEANANDNGGHYEIADSSQECPEYGLRRGLVDRGYGGNVLACIGPLPAHYPFNDAETSLVSGARVHITEFCCRHRLSTERSPLIDAD